MVYANNTPTNFTGDWSFGIDSFLGVSSVGTWTVSVSDAFGGVDNGELYSASLEFFGEQVTNDDVYHFTDDFLTYVAEDGTRATIHDTDEGTDWVNFTAVAGDIIISLISGSVFSVDGTQWGQLGSGADVFENIITSDGDDIITGNDLANEIYGMRGDDIVYGGDGNDVIYGGGGTDTLNDGGFEGLMFGRSIFADQDDLIYHHAKDDLLNNSFDHDRDNHGIGQSLI